MVGCAAGWSLAMSILTRSTARRLQDVQRSEVVCLHTQEGTGLVREQAVVQARVDKERAGEIVVGREVNRGREEKLRQG